MVLPDPANGSKPSPDRALLLRRHEALGLGDTVRFLGFRDDVEDLLRAADLFCISSHLEGMGTSILDAMAAGLAVVATRTGGIPEIVSPGETGILVPPSDPGALAGALEQLGLDPELRAAYGAAGRRRVRAYSADRTAERTREVYLEAWARRSRSG